ncbi:MAG: class I SAM-dependent methyltransferase, partial [Sedimenticola sp.]|nr:class I SAM-dependent methyltransferase [Sedimenticola sp.]
MKLLEFNPESNRCIICNSNMLNSYKAYASDSQTESRVSIKECKSCTFAWQYPRGRTQEESVQFFEGAYHDKGKDKSTPYFDPLRKISIANLEFSFIKSLPGYNSSILDIGAGGGFFAQVAAENGCTVTAVDPALELSQISGNSNIIP